mgnify:FL=1
MPSTLIARATQRVSLRMLLVYLLVAGGVIAFTGNVALVAGLATAFFITETRQILKNAPGIDDRWVTVGLAVVVLAVSLVWLIAEFRQPAALRTLWAPVVAVIGGLWLLLDARVDLVYNQPRGSSDSVDNLDAGVFLLRMLRVNRIADTLESGPKTVPEIAAASDLTEPQVQAAIELAGDDGPIVRIDDATEPESSTDLSDDAPRYALDTHQLGATALVRLAVGGLANLLRRLARPVLGPA